MLKRYGIRKIILSSFTLLIVSLIYLIPNDIKDLEVEKTEQYTNINIDNKLSEVYLLDSNGFIARAIITIKEEKELENKVKELIEMLIIDGKNQSIIPNGFRSIIPVDTKILNMKIEDNIVKIDFSKELLEINEENEEKMIEAICYTLTSIKDIKGVIIYVEGEMLTQLPKSKKILPTILKRIFGINKVYDINDIKNVSGTTVYYINKYNNNYYYVPVTKYVNNDGKDKVKIIIDELSGTYTYQNNLMSFLNSNVELLNYEILDSQIKLEFNNYLLDDIEKSNILEEVKYAISLSIMDNYDVDEVIFYVEDREITKTFRENIE